MIALTMDQCSAPGRCHATGARTDFRMDFQLSLEPHDILTVHLREGEEQTTVSVHPASAGARSLSRALEDALANGYGECFWPGATGGQYWWMFKRDADTL